MSLPKIYIDKELFDITNFNAPFIYESQGGTSDFRLQNSYFRLSNFEQRISDFLFFFNFRLNFYWLCKFLQQLCFGAFRLLSKVMPI